MGHSLSRASLSISSPIPITGRDSSARKRGKEDETKTSQLASPPILATSLVSSEEGMRELTAKYRLDREALGKGHYGTVHRCFSQDTGQALACKKIEKRKVRQKERLKTEVALMTKLDHPSIIKMYDVFEDERFLYIVMELCSGGELFDRIISKTESGQTYSEEDAARLMMQILDALEYIHEKKIIHRDLKPENFLFRDASEASDLVIIDFGLSREFDPSGAQGAFMSTKVGTPYYVAPEVLGRQYTAACDLWSTGVIMYILLCGAPPFYGDQDQDIFRMIRNHEVNFPPDYGWDNVSLDAMDLIRALLSKDPSKRPDASGAKAHPWFKNMNASHADGGLKVPKVVREQAVQDDGSIDVTAIAAAAAVASGTEVAESTAAEDTKSRAAISGSLIASAKQPIISRAIGRRLHAFVAMNRLKKIALNVIATQLTESEIGDLRRLFDDIDTDKSGTLELSELEQALASTHGTVHDQIQTLMQGIDLDENQSIDYHEFLAATMERNHYMKEDRVQKAFDYFACLESNGDANQIEFCTLVDILGGAHHAEAVLSDFDQDGDRKIDFEEFKVLISSGPHPSKVSQLSSQVGSPRHADGGSSQDDGTTGADRAAPASILGETDGGCGGGNGSQDQGR